MPKGRPVEAGFFFLNIFDSFFVMVWPRSHFPLIQSERRGWDDQRPEHRGHGEAAGEGVVDSGAGESLRGLYKPRCGGGGGVRSS